MWGCWQWECVWNAHWQQCVVCIGLEGPQREQPRHCCSNTGKSKKEAEFQWRLEVLRGRCRSHQGSIICGPDGPRLIGSASRPAGLLTSQAWAVLCSCASSRWEKIISHICMKEISRKNKAIWFHHCHAQLGKIHEVGMGIVSFPSYLARTP